MKHQHHRMKEKNINLSEYSWKIQSVQDDEDQYKKGAKNLNISPVIVQKCIKGIYQIVSDYEERGIRLKTIVNRTYLYCYWNIELINRALRNNKSKKKKKWGDLYISISQLTILRNQKIETRKRILKNYEKVAELGIIIDHNYHSYY